MTETIRCRAQLEADCYDGSPMSRQTGEDDAVMADDGTFTGRSIVCDACYVRLIPLTRSQQALNDELPEAISCYRENRAYLFDQPVERLRVLIADALAAARKGGFGPYGQSARVMAQLARRALLARLDERLQSCCRG
jgi:hypothetical protein